MPDMHGGSKNSEWVAKRILVQVTGVEEKDFLVPQTLAASPESPAIEPNRPNIRFLA
jgi:hypothetical protein